MLVKQKGFSIAPGTLYGFAGGVFGVVTVGFMISSHLAPDSYASCSSRYAQAGMFTLKRSNGALLNPADLQSRLGGREWGVLHNVSVDKSESDKHEAAMTIKFEAGGTFDRARRRAASGVGFKWQPGWLNNANAACLSYSVRVPKNFKFGNGGTLPGLFGTDSKAPVTAKEAFSTRMRWLHGAKVGVQTVNDKHPNGELTPFPNNWLKFPRGEWVEIEQEVVLNSPGQKDGKMRVWVNGELQLNVSDLSFRKSADARFKGVIVDTHFSKSSMAWAPSPKTTNMKLSPMVLRWN